MISWRCSVRMLVRSALGIQLCRRWREGAGRAVEHRMRQPQTVSANPTPSPPLPTPGTSGADMAPSGLPYAFIQPLMPQAVLECGGHLYMGMSLDQVSLQPKGSLKGLLTTLPGLGPPDLLEGRPVRIAVASAGTSRRKSRARVHSKNV